MLCSDSCASCTQVPTASVAAGDMVRVLPGERIPVDAEVLAGRAVADESMLTGEAALVPKSAGDQVCMLDSMHPMLWLKAPCAGGTANPPADSKRQ